jgi:hypothetical protein
MARRDHRLVGRADQLPDGDLQTLELHMDRLLGGLKNRLRGLTPDSRVRGRAIRDCVHDLQRSLESLGDRRGPACSADCGEAAVDADDDGIFVLSRPAAVA